MAFGLNRVAIVGEIAKEPEVRSGKTSGKPWAKFAVGISEERGVGQAPVVLWIDVVAFGTAAEALRDARKHDLISVDGKLAVNSWDGQDGKTRTRLEVHANQVSVLSRGLQEQPSLDPFDTDDPVPLPPHKSSSDPPF